MISNNLKNKSKRRQRSKVAKQMARFQNLALSSVPNQRLSLLGPTAPRMLDCLIPIYAVNSIGGPYYSFATTTAAPTMSVNISTLIVGSFPEYSQMVRAYGLIQLRGIELRVTRSSPLSVNTSVIGDTPAIFLQTSLTQYSAGSVTQQRSLATSDNCMEVNLQTYDSFLATVAFPPAVSSRSSILNDVYVFGSATWSPTAIGSTQTLPDIFLNLGSLASPSFQSGAANNAFQIASVHLVLQVVFSGTQSL
jgi:hypothetical protein